MRFVRPNDVSVTPEPDYFMADDLIYEHGSIFYPASYPNDRVLVIDTDCVIYIDDETGYISPFRIGDFEPDSKFYRVNETLTIGTMLNSPGDE